MMSDVVDRLPGNETQYNKPVVFCKTLLLQYQGVRFEIIRVKIGELMVASIPDMFAPQVFLVA